MGAQAKQWADEIVSFRNLNPDQVRELSAALAVKANAMEGLRACGCPPPSECPGRHASHLRSCRLFEPCQGGLCLGSDECDGH